MLGQHVGEFNFDYGLWVHNTLQQRKQANSLNIHLSTKHKEIIHPPIIFYGAENLLTYHPIIYES